MLLLDYRLNTVGAKDVFANRDSRSVVIHHVHTNLLLTPVGKGDVQDNLLVPRLRYPSFVVTR